jgi:MHS family proline/betaine transporter-like MFS transporter
MKKYSFFLAPFVGNLFEWYEFAVYSGLSAVIGKIFFHAGDVISNTLSGFVVYGVGFIARPIGTCIFGYLGDKYGRKKALSISLAIMCVATLAIGLLPTAVSIGAMAATLLILFRILQGISLGGEFSSVVTFTCESAPTGKKGLFSAMQAGAVPLGMMFGILTIFVMNKFLSEEQIENFWWRVPFLIGVILGIVGSIIRAKAKETSEFEANRKAGGIVANPLLTLFTTYKSKLFLGILCMLVVSSFAQVFLVGSKSIIGDLLGFGSEIGSSTALLLFPVVLVFVILMGMLCDRFDIMKLHFILVSSIIIFSNLACLMLQKNNLYLVTAGFLIIAAIIGLSLGFYPTYLYKRIPVAVRDSGVGFSIAIPTVLTGGFGMVIMISLFKKYGESGFLIFSLSMSFLALLSLIADRKLIKRKKEL